MRAHSDMATLYFVKVAPCVGAWESKKEKNDNASVVVRSEGQRKDHL